MSLAHDFFWLTVLGSSPRGFGAGETGPADGGAVPVCAGAESGGRNRRLSAGLSVARSKCLARAIGFFILAHTLLVLVIGEFRSEP